MTSPANARADRIVVVDDDARIRDLLRRYLSQEGFDVLLAEDAKALNRVLTRETVDLIVLDLMLPGEDGLSICRRLRAANDQTPIIMLTARDEDIDKILGLELGADDYLTKPFNPRELIARVKAILRRSNGKKQADGKPLHRGDLTIDPVSREVSIASQILDLRTQEFDLLFTLAEQPGRVFTREQLLQLAWGFDFYGQTRTVDVHIAHLRKKLEGSNIKIETVTGVGYKLVV